MSLMNIAEDEAVAEGSLNVKLFIVRSPPGQPAAPPPGQRYPLVPNFYMCPPWDGARGRGCVVPPAQHSGMTHFNRTMEEIAKGEWDVEVDHLGRVHVRPPTEEEAEEHGYSLSGEPNFYWSHDHFYNLQGRTIPLKDLVPLDKAIERWKMHATANTMRQDVYEALSKAVVLYDAMISGKEHLAKRIKLPVNPDALGHDERIAFEVDEWTAPSRFEECVYSPEWFHYVHKNMQWQTIAHWPPKEKEFEDWFLAKRGTVVKRIYIRRLWKYVKTVAKATEVAWYWYELGIKRHEARRIEDKEHVAAVRNGMDAELEAQGYTDVQLVVDVDP